MRVSFFFPSKLFTLEKGEGEGVFIAVDSLFLFFRFVVKGRTKVAHDSKKVLELSSGVTVLRCSLPLSYRVASASDKITEFHRCRVTFLIPPVSHSSTERVNYGCYTYIYSYMYICIYIIRNIERYV